MSWSRRQLLTTAGALAFAPRLVRAARGGSSADRKLIVVMCDGGWDTTFCYDPKFSSPYIDGPWVDEDPNNPLDREGVRSYGDITITVNDLKRPSVSRFFERWSDQAAVVNGTWIGSLAHPPCRVRALTGSTLQTSPSFATIIGAELGASLPLGSIDMSGMAFTGPLAATVGQVGFQNQLKLLVKDDANFPPPLDGSIAYPQYLPTEDDRAALFAHLAARHEQLLARVDDGGFNARKLADRIESMARAQRFRTTGAEALDLLTLGAAPTLREQADLAVELLRSDLAATVSLNSGVFWDTHALNVGQHGLWEHLFDGLDHLMDRLTETGMIEHTTVVAISEMTRSPTLNLNAGKDHWPHASALLLGAGVIGGRVYGGTDERGESLHVDYATGEVDPAGGLVRYDNLAAGLVQLMGVDPGPWYREVVPYLPFAAGV
jgi:hypothetical protein